MRANVLILVAAAAVGLAGCKGSSLPDENVGLGMCGLNCPTDTTDGGSGSDTSGGTQDETIDGGNSGGLKGGDTTIALEKSVLKSPSGGSTSTLTLDDTNKTAVFAINTKTKTSSAWPEKKKLDLYQEGVDATNQPGLGGIGAGEYQEYRKLSSSDSGTAVDEELQVWNFGSSYGTQYRDVGSGGEAAHQAWSFGGNATPLTALTSAKASYSGRFGATAKSSNWLAPDDPNNKQTIDINGIWRIRGSTNIDVDFGSKTVDGTLTPETWNAFQSKNNATGFKDVTASNTSDPNNFAFMRSQVKIKGTITGNTYSGTASLKDPTTTQLGWVSGDNPVFGGFFGSKANETTGVFAVLGTSPDPIGGDLPINDDRRGYLEMSGVFNGKCKASSKGCKP